MNVIKLNGEMVNKHFNLYLYKKTENDSLIFIFNFINDNNDFSHINFYVNYISPYQNDLENYNGKFNMELPESYHTLEGPIKLEKYEEFNFIFFDVPDEELFYLKLLLN